VNERSLRRFWGDLLERSPVLVDASQVMRCVLGQECGCGRCLDDVCLPDDECAEGETCERQESCIPSAAFHCTTPADECEPEPINCTCEEGRWRPYGGTCE
jgi:hypothetical protein